MLATLLLRRRRVLEYVRKSGDSDVLGETSGIVTLSKTYNLQNFPSGDYGTAVIISGYTKSNCRSGSISVSMKTTVDGVARITSGSSEYDAITIIKDPYTNSLYYKFNSVSLTKDINLATWNTATQIDIDWVSRHSKGGPCYGGLYTEFRVDTYQQVIAT